MLRVTAPAPECLCPTVEPAATTQEPAGTTAAPTTTTTAAVETSAATTTTAAGAESTGVAHTIRAAKAVAEKIKSTVSSPSANIRDGVGGQAKAEAVPCEGWYGIGAASLCGAVFFVTSILVGPLGFYIGRRERHRSGRSSIELRFKIANLIVLSQLRSRARPTSNLHRDYGRCNGGAHPHRADAGLRRADGPVGEEE